MNTRPIILFLSAAILLPGGLHAAGRASADGHVRMLADYVGAGGRPLQSASASPVITAQTGIESFGAARADNVAESTSRDQFTGTLADPTAFAVVASSTTVSEGGTVTLSGSVTYDDDSSAVIPGAWIGWGTPTGPLSPVQLSFPSASTQAGNVLANTAGNVTGTFMAGALSDSETINVLNSGSDNYGAYAGDGIDDAWESGYGVTMPFDPAGDSDHDGMGLLLEAFLNLNPNVPDAQSLPSPVQITDAGQKYLGITFRRHKRIARSYAVRLNSGLNAPDWSTSGIVAVPGSPLSLDADTELHTFRMVSPISAANRSFLQLWVSE